jgi:limonene-1,2-epoxide hydrolase
MKQIIAIAAICMLIFSCTSNGEKKEKENLAVAEKYMNAVETMNLAAMDSLLADNYMGYGPSVTDSINKQGAILNWKFLIANMYESVKYTRHKEIAVTVKEGETIGDWVLNWALLTIKFKDGSGPVNVWVNIVYRIENGKIVHSRTFYDEADVMRQLGYSMTK